jgi:hypothetical protein
MAAKFAAAGVVGSVGGYPGGMGDVWGGSPATMKLTGALHQQKVTHFI